MPGVCSGEGLRRVVGEGLPERSGFACCVRDEGARWAVKGGEEDELGRPEGRMGWRLKALVLESLFVY